MKAHKNGRRKRKPPARSTTVFAMRIPLKDYVGLEHWATEENRSVANMATVFIREGIERRAS